MSHLARKEHSAWLIAPVAQLDEHRFRRPEDAGSNPVGGIRFQSQVKCAKDQVNSEVYRLLRVKIRSIFTKAEVFVNTTLTPVSIVYILLTIAGSKHGGQRNV